MDQPKEDEDKTSPEEVLAEILGETNGLALFAAIYPYFAYIPEGGTEGEYGTNPAKLELAAFHFLKDLDEAGNPTADPYEISAAMGAIDNLFYKFFSPIRDFDPNAKVEPFEHIVREVQMDASLIRGNAYPFQTEEKIRDVQGKFSSFFSGKLGLTPVKAVEIVNAMVSVSQEKGQAFIDRIRAAGNKFADEWKKDSTDAIEDESAAKVFGGSFEQGKLGITDLPVSFDEVAQKIQVTETEWTKFLSMFGIGHGANALPADFEEMRRFPMVVFEGKRALLWDLSNALDQIYSRFEAEIKADQPWFEKYQTWRGDWLEEKTFQYLTKLFPANCVYRTVDYPNPDGGTAEVDIVVYWEPFILFFEAKAGTFRYESQLGDAGRLRTDLKKNLQDAFDQAKRAAQYYESCDRPQFTERDTRLVIPVSKANVKKLFLCTTSLERFGQLASKLAVLAPMGLFTGKEYPWSVVLSDLQIISDFVEHADVFLHFIDRRLEVQKHEIHIRADELDFLGAYLKDRLSFKQLTEDEDKKPNYVWMSGFSSDFDAYYGAFGTSGGEPIRIDLPANIKKILNELRARTNDISARHLAFLLLDLPDSTLHAIADGFEQMWAQVPKDGQFRRCTVNHENTAISIMAAKDLPKYLIHERTNFRAAAEKYRFKVETGIGFGIDLTDPSKYFYSMAYVEGPWEHDDYWEKALQKEPPTQFDKNSLPGRNDPCICGSTKKFKKCCLPRIKIK